jgi:hypothetical protein
VTALGKTLGITHQSGAKLIVTSESVEAGRARQLPVEDDPAVWEPGDGRLRALGSMPTEDDRRHDSNGSSASRGFVADSPQSVVETLAGKQSAEKCRSGANHDS